MTSGFADWAPMRWEEKSTGRQDAADPGAAELRAGLHHRRLERVPVRIVQGDVIELLAVGLDQRAGDRLGLHLRRVADAEDVPMAARAGDGVGMAAGNDVKDFLLVGNLRDRERERRVLVAEQEIDLVAVDQLAGLQHGRARVAAGGILDDQLDLATENAALRVDLIDRELTANQFVFAIPRKGASERVVKANLQGVGGSRAQDERTSDLQDADRETRLEKGAATDP
jgi:hypothetical protein